MNLNIDRNFVNSEFFSDNRFEIEYSMDCVEKD